MKTEEIVKELRDLLDCNNFKHVRDDIEALITKLQPKHRHISSGNLNYSQTYYTCETCGADIEDEDEELDVSQNKITELGDELCKWCPLDKKGAYSVPGGFMAGCEGSHCKEAYENYMEEK